MMIGRRRRQPPRRATQFGLFVAVVIGAIVGIRYWSPPRTLPVVGWQQTLDHPRIAYKYLHDHPEAPTLLFVHGGPGDNSAYLIAPLEQRLRVRYNVIWYDQRGTGKSERRLSYHAYATTAHVEDIRRVQDAAGAQRVILVAHSWGAIPAGLYAAQYPDRVRGLININGPGSYLDTEGGLLKYLKIVDQRDPGKLAELKAIEQMPHGFIRFIRLTKCARDAGAYYKEFAKTKGEIAAYLEQAVANGEYTKAEIEESDEALMVPMDLHSLGTTEIYAALEQVQAPTLVIAGKYDHVVDVETVRRYSQAIPNAQLVIFDQSGHHPFQEEPEKFDATLDEFVSHLP